MARPASGGATCPPRAGTRSKLPFSVKRESHSGQVEIGRHLQGSQGLPLRGPYGRCGTKSLRFGMVHKAFRFRRTTGPKECIRATAPLLLKNVLRCLTSGWNFPLQFLSARPWGNRLEASPNLFSTRILVCSRDASSCFRIPSCLFRLHILLPKATITPPGLMITLNIRGNNHLMSAPLQHAGSASLVVRPIARSFVFDFLKRQKKCVATLPTSLSD